MLFRIKLLKDFPLIENFILYLLVPWNTFLSPLEESEDGRWRLISLENFQNSAGDNISFYYPKSITFNNFIFILFFVDYHVIWDKNIISSKSKYRTFFWWIHICKFPFQRNFKIFHRLPAMWQPGSHQFLYLCTVKKIYIEYPLLCFSFQ